MYITVRLPTPLPDSNISITQTAPLLAVGITTETQIATAQEISRTYSSSKLTSKPTNQQTNAMPVTHTRSTRPSLMARLKARTFPRRSPRTHGTHTTHTTMVPRISRRHHRTHAPTTTTYTAEPVHHHKRKTSISDKISGAMLKMKGTLTRRPGQKAAGTRRMRGTDGRGARRYY